MSGKHRTAPAPARSQHAEHSVTPGSTTIKRSAGAIWFPASIAVAFAGFSAAVVVAHSEPHAVAEQPAVSAHTVAQPQALPEPQTLSQLGTIVAVSADSITTRSADGLMQTYRVTPQTAAVTSSGGQSFTSATPFAVNDEVAVHATVSSGLATATAVADQTVIGQHGVPMDSM